MKRSTMFTIFLDGLCFLYGILFFGYIWGYAQQPNPFDVLKPLFLSVFPFTFGPYICGCAMLCTVIFIQRLPAKVIVTIITAFVYCMATLFSLGALMVAYKWQDLLYLAPHIFILAGFVVAVARICKKHIKAYQNV